jgi:hypothetical protein
MLGLLFVRRPTRAELKVIFFLAAVLCFCFGGVAITLGVMAPAAKTALAHQAILYGGVSVGLGVVFSLFFWLLRRSTDRG